jgi:hypothetical protein
VNGAWRLALVAGGLAVAVVLFFVLRDNGNDNGKSATSTQATTSTQTTTQTTTPPPPPKPQVATIVYRNGRVVGGLKHISTTKGKRLTVVVNADVSDEVHVHGYDLKRNVAPGAPGRISFRATLPGRFVIELESRGFQIAELEVQP